MGLSAVSPDLPDILSCDTGDSHCKETNLRRVRGREVINGGMTLTITNPCHGMEIGVNLQPGIIRSYGLTTLNKAKSGQVSNKEVVTQNIFNASVLTSVELKKYINRL